MPGPKNSDQAAREQVFVVDRDAFFGGGDWPQGYHRLDNAPEFLARAFELGRFVDREEAEATPAWKQWIPYCMLRCGSWNGEVGTEQAAAERGVLLVQRTKKGSETRLHESWSLGLGGHINPIDIGLHALGITSEGSSDTHLAEGLTDAATPAEQFFETALNRELQEELRLPPASELPRPRLLGLINDDSTEVGQVHAGLAYTLDLELPLTAARELVGIREISKMRGAFTSLVEFAKLWHTPSQFESWSQFLIQAEIVGAMGGSSWNGPASAENETGFE